MDIVRNPDGTLVVPVQPERWHDTEEAADEPATSSEAEGAPVEVAPTTRVLHPGEGGYDDGTQ